MSPQTESGAAGAGPVQAPAGGVTYLFSDVEGSTRLWETEPERVGPALAWHDQLSREMVQRHRGHVVKMTGDGIHAAFDDPADAVAAVLGIQIALNAPQAIERFGGLTLRVRCGLHAGADQRRDNDFFGRAVNRAARIMQAAHGGQILLSEAVADRVQRRLPERASMRDLGVVRLRDLTGPERLFQLVHPDLRADFPALRSLASTPNNLAQQVNSFVGRARELAEVRAQLADPSIRLLTLLGMGGLGKSRLSVQVAAEVLDDFPDGVWFVELAPLSDPRSVVQAVASVLGVKEEAGGPVLDAVLKYARDKSMLVVLDNCEHVVQACAELARQLLQTAPQLKLLTSSRDALQIAGETVYQVAPLSAPARDAATTLEALAGIDAVRLFIDRATAAQPSFRVTERNAAAVADICRRLDGIPLALELAAARTRALTVEAIAARLNDRFRLLVTGDRTVLPRQRTLRALIDWSYDLLAPQERTLFQRLSVFAGGWTLEAAEAVGAGGAVDAGDVLDLLARLVEKSLVMVDVDGGRYRMLDTVRQYALERLQETGEQEAVRAHHFDYHLSFAEQARPALAGEEQATWLGRLDDEHENLLSAYDWSEHLADAGARGLRLVHALRPYWINRGLLSLGHRLSVDLLKRPDLGVASDERCRALGGAGQMCFFAGRDGEARVYLTESLGIARQLENTPWIAAVLQPLGMACLAQRDFESARAHLEEAVSLAQAVGNRRELAAALNALGMLHRLEGRLDLAAPLCETVLELTRELSDPEYTAIALLNLAMVRIDLGDGQRAAPLLTQAAALGEQLGSSPVIRSVVEVSAGLAATFGDARVAAVLYGVAQREMEATGLRRDPADEAFLAPHMARVREALGDSGFASAQAAGLETSLAAALERVRAQLAAAQSRPPAAG